ncbi:ExeA family protein [Sedimenticola selenatireducens]|nr:AAA family ATPase [Sedimenticola selenatireducens]
MQSRRYSSNYAPALAREIGGKGAHYMPIRLKHVLAEHGIPQGDWCAAVIQNGGRNKGQGLSQPMGNLILNWGTWPKLTTEEVIKKQTRQFLLERGVSDEFLGNELWLEIEGRARHTTLQPHGKQPQGSRPGAEDSDNETLEETLPENEMLSQQAKRHFKLFNDPFIDDVKGPEDVYLSEDQRYIREAMYYAAKNGGFLAVIGESGAGKSTLRKDLIDRINRNGEAITIIQPRIIDKGRLTAGAICDAIIQDVSSEAPKRTLESKARQIERLLTGSGRSGNAHVLIIEEAHDLTIATLKYLKRFWELEDGFKRLLGIVLVGQPELKGTLDLRRNWDAREVINRCEIAELHPLNGNLEEYIRNKLKRVGKELDDIFQKDAFDAIRTRLQIPGRGLGATVSMMYPLMVNNTISKAMNLTAEIGESRVSAEIIKGV